MNLDFCRTVFTLGLLSGSLSGGVALADTFPVDTPLCTPPPSTSASRSNGLVELNASQDSCGLPTSSFPIEIFSLAKKAVCRLEDGPGRYPDMVCSGDESSGSPSPGPILGSSVPWGPHLPGFSNPYPNSNPKGCATLTGFSGEVSALGGCSGDRDSAPSPKTEPEPSLWSDWLSVFGFNPKEIAIAKMIERFGPDTFNMYKFTNTTLVPIVNGRGIEFVGYLSINDSVKVVIMNPYTPNYKANVYIKSNGITIPLGVYTERSSTLAGAYATFSFFERSVLEKFFYDTRFSIRDLIDSIIAENRPK